MTDNEIEKMIISEKELFKENRLIQKQIMKRLLYRSEKDCNTYWKLYDILKNVKCIGIENALRFENDTSVWCEVVNNYKCIFITNGNIENYEYIIILYNSKVNEKEKFFKVYRIYDDIDLNNEIPCGRNKKYNKYLKAHIYLQYTDNIKNNKYVSRPNFKYISDNIEKLLYDENFNYEISTIFEYSVEIKTQPSCYRIQLNEIFNFFAYMSFVLQKVREKCI